MPTMHRKNTTTNCNPSKIKRCTLCVVHGNSVVRVRWIAAPCRLLLVRWLWPHQSISAVFATSVGWHVKQTRVHDNILNGYDSVPIVRKMNLRDAIAHIGREKELHHCKKLIPISIHIHDRTNARCLSFRFVQLYNYLFHRLDNYYIYLYIYICIYIYIYIYYNKCNNV